MFSKDFRFFKKKFAVLLSKNKRPSLINLKLLSLLAVQEEPEIFLRNFYRDMRSFSVIRVLTKPYGKPSFRKTSSKSENKRLS